MDSRSIRFRSKRSTGEQMYIRVLIRRLLSEDLGDTVKKHRKLLLDIVQSPKADEMGTPADTAPYEALDGILEYFDQFGELPKGAGALLNFIETNEIVINLQRRAEVIRRELEGLADNVSDDEMAAVTDLNV